MPVTLPCSLTKTAGGADLYVDQNPALPVGQSVYFNAVVAPGGGAPGGVVPFGAVYPVYVPGVLPSVTNGVGLGYKIPPGVYLARLAVPAVGEAANGFTKGCFTFTWDGVSITAGASSNPSNDSGAAQCYITTATNGTTGIADILVWGWRNLVGANTLAQVEVILLQRVDAFTPLF
jgi:hypothetical protein